MTVNMITDIIWWALLPTLGVTLVAVGVRQRIVRRDHWWLHTGATETAPPITSLPTTSAADREFEEIARAALAEREEFLAFAAAEFAAIDKALEDLRISAGAAVARAERWHARDFTWCERCHHQVGARRTVAMIRDWRIDTPTGAHQLITPSALAAAVLVS